MLDPVPFSNQDCTDYFVKTGVGVQQILEELFVDFIPRFQSKKTSCGVYRPDWIEKSVKPGVMCR